MALPATATVGRTGHGSTPACWAERRQIHTTVGFVKANEQDAFVSRPLDPKAVTLTVASFLGAAPDDVTIQPAALDWQSLDPRHSRDGLGKQRPAETFAYHAGFVCASLVRQAGTAGTAIAPCDPLDTRRSDAGGLIRLTRADHPDAVGVSLRLPGNGPQCRNRVRHFVNRTFGLDDPA